MYWQNTDSGEIFSLKFTKYRLAAGLCPDTLGELKRSPRPPSRNKGATSKGMGREGRGEGGTCSKVLGGIDAPATTTKRASERL